MKKLILIVSVFLSSLVYSQDTYTSFQTGNWGTASTWTGAAGTPDANDTVIIQDVTPPTVSCAPTDHGRSSGDRSVPNSATQAGRGGSAR